MLPAYLVTGLHRRRQLVAMTFVFVTGVCTVILPVSLSATALSRLINGDHMVVCSVLVARMLAMGAMLMLGVKIPLPVIGMRLHGGGGVRKSVGARRILRCRHRCCAPVLPGVVALSGAAANFVTALVIGVAYVFGMVAPLFILAVAWAVTTGITRNCWVAAPLISISSVVDGGRACPDDRRPRSRWPTGLVLGCRVHRAL
jgi:cytochrome c-type biogenesis protein